MKAAIATCEVYRKTVLFACLCAAFASLALGVSRPAQAQHPTQFGVDLAWSNYGGDFGMDFYYPGDGPNYNGSTWQAWFDDMKSKNMNICRIWTMEDFSGLSFQNNNADDPCTGVSQAFINNLVDCVTRANNDGICVYVTFLTYEDVSKHPNVIGSNLSSFINNAIVPVAKALASKWVQYDLLNEANYANQSAATIQNYGRQAMNAIHTNGTHWVTISTDNASYLTGTLLSCNFDFYDCHCYSTSGSPLQLTPSQVGGKPLLAGEFGPNNGWANYSNSQDQTYVNNFCNDATNKGYTGLLAWSYLGGSPWQLQGTNTLWVLQWWGNDWGVN